MRGLILVLAVAACSSSSNVGRDVGARCDSSDECDDRCLPPADFPGGFCTLSCEQDEQCPGGTYCVDVEGGVCLFDCNENVDCEFLGADYQCRTEAPRTGGENVEVCR